ncbi:MAG: hypothetical protein GX187_06095 [Clostridiaceae bacterium]|nr:hypothetical protein [Clostridiaceae bacterium]
MKNPLFEKDILYKTGTEKEPGSVCVRIYPPDITGRVPLLIEQKSNHDPLEYIDPIIAVLQADIFDRMQIDIKTQSIPYFKKRQEKDYYLLKFSEDGTYSTEATKSPYS